MAKVTKATIVAKIQENTGLTKYKAKKGLKATLFSIQRALGDGKRVDLGKLGRLVVVKRERKRVIKRNLRGPYASSIVELHKKHPKSVRLLGGKDLSDDPKPTIVHKKQPEQQVIPARSRHVRVAVPQFRGRPNMPRRVR
jgi:nucleoid DNA-binding protein